MNELQGIPLINTLFNIAFIASLATIAVLASVAIYHAFRESNQDDEK